MDQLRVIKLDDGPPAINCPRCDEEIAPVKNALFSEWDCPSCGGAIAASTLRLYMRALRRWRDSAHEE